LGRLERLKDAGVELLRFAPVLGWAAGVIVAVLFVFFLGILANLYFSK
jgi:tetrahydromethanopterin S-methyltransferase subunit F